MALVALPLLILLSLFMTPAESTAGAGDGATDGSGRRPAAALVAPADQGEPGTAEGGLGPLGLAALVGVGLVPTFVLISRRRQHRHQPN
jgi:hypothetical protein